MYVSDEDAAREMIARLRANIEQERAVIIKRITRWRQDGTTSELDERAEWDAFARRVKPMQVEIDVIVGLLAQKISLEGPAPVILPPRI